MSICIEYYFRSVPNMINRRRYKTRRRGKKPEQVSRRVSTELRARAANFTADRNGAVTRFGNTSRRWEGALVHHVRWPNEALCRRRYFNGGLCASVYGSAPKKRNDKTSGLFTRRATLRPHCPEVKCKRFAFHAYASRTKLQSYPRP